MARMKRASFADMNCSVAQALEVVGEWWSPLIVRDLMLGVSRFDDFQERLGISRNVLTERLGRLEVLGIVERVPYQEKPPRYDYRLTEKGRDLWVVMTALREWGDRWAAPGGAPIVTLHRTCGHEATMVPTCSHCGEVLEVRDLKAVHGPARGDALPVPRH